MNVKPTKAPRATGRSSHSTSDLPGALACTLMTSAIDQAGVLGDDS